MILPGSTTEYCQTQKHDHLQTRQSTTLCSVHPPFAFNTQDETYRGSSDQSVSAYEQWRASSAASICRSLQRGQKNTMTNMKSHDLLKRNNKKNKQTGNKFPEIWLLHLPAKVSKDWGTGETQRPQQGQAMAGPRALSPPFWNQRAVIGQSCRSFLRDLQVGQTECGRRCCAAGLLLDAPRTADKRHSVRCSPPQSTPPDGPAIVALWVSCL